MVNSKRNYLFIFSLNDSNNMKTSSEVTFTLRRLSLAYHSIPVSNICHQGNPCRGILLLLNCAVTEMPWNRRHRNYLHFANSFKKEEKERHQSGSVTTLILHRSSRLPVEKNINVVLRGGVWEFKRVEPINSAHHHQHGPEAQATGAM